MRQVAIYIKDTITLKYNRLDLFTDEKISINSSIQNINDISKTYTDFSQSFTVPGSINNNRIFKHWYENSNDNGFSTLNKSDAYIEIDTVRFKTGKIQLESANLQDGDIKNYTINFIGSLGNLKDKFAGLSLKDLSTSDVISYLYSAENVKNAVTTTTQSGIVMWPLISSDKYWTYISSNLFYDIHKNSQPIYYDDLFPALSLDAIFTIIEYQFKINFYGTFLNDKRFTSAYLWLKNAEKFKFKISQLIDINATTTNDNPYSSVNYTTDTITTNLPDNTYKTMLFTIGLQFTVANLPYSIQVYKNGIKFGLPFSAISSTSFTSPFGFESNEIGIVNYTFQIESAVALTFYNVNITCGYRYLVFSKGGVVPVVLNSIYTQTTSQQTLITYLDLNYYMPDMKIEEFFSGILKMFNLTCYSNDGINYYIEQLENYYLSGEIRDITKYTKSDVIALNRVNTYSSIKFEYQPSESIVNKGFLSANNIEYGTYRYETTYDGSEYSIKLPFEDLNFNRFTLTTLQVGYALKSDLQKYTPKPVILYDYNPSGLTPANATYHFAITPSSGSGVGQAYTQYKAFGQETLVTVGAQSATYSLNFPSQPSTLTNEIVENGLYKQYYQNYLSNIFNMKARLVKISSVLPLSILTTIKLNDRIVIRDKRYIINTMTTNLTNGETQFELLTDMRTAPVIPPSAVNDVYSITVNDLDPIDLFPMVNDTLGTTPTIITAVNSSITTGTITITGGGSKLTFTPNGSSGPFIGETFTYTITDNVGSTSTATVSLNIISTILPAAVNDAYNITINDLNPIDLFPMVNDTLGVTPTTITAVNSSITTGTITITGGGSKLTFTPNGSSANETFTYTITDNIGNTSTATVNLNVTSTILPVAVNDTYNITVNDFNPIDLFPMVNDTLGVTPTTITAVNSSITTGTITITGFGSQLWFTPNGSSANETFTYTITDNIGNTSTATVNLNVTSTLPAAVNDAYNITVNNLNPINLFPMVNDELGTTPTIITAVNSSITTGTITITGGGSQLTFTPNGTSGPFIGETFNYSITDSINNTSSATVSLNVISTILPVAVNDTYNIVLGDLDPIDLFPMVNDTLGVTPTIITVVNSSITTGTITITGFGSQLWFTPNGTSANETFTYTITDNIGNTSAATVSLNVTSTITPPEDDIQPPSLVGSLSTNYAYDTGFTAFWNVATDNVGVTGYNIKLDGLLYDTVFASNTLSYSFDGLQSNTLYTVSVAAFDAAGNIGPYRDANATTTDNGLSPI